MGEQAPNIVRNFTEKYFDMNKKHARDALDIYKKFLLRMDRVGEFLKVAEVSNNVVQPVQRAKPQILPFRLSVSGLTKVTFPTWQG